MLSRQLTFEKNTVQVSDSRPPIKTDFEYSDAAHQNPSILSSQTDDNSEVDDENLMAKS